MPYGIVGKPYTIFPAKAYDYEDGEREVSVFAFYGYQSSVRVPLAITDGKFTPKFVGKYQIVYFASDNSGNIAEKVVEVNVKSDSTLQMQLPTGVVQ